MVMEIRAATGPGGKLQWYVGVDDDFIEVCMGESEEWRLKLVQRWAYMIEQTVGKALGVRPQ